MYDFTGRTVAITGGAGILGSEIASALAGCGAQVAILDVNPEAGKAAVERMGEHGKQVSVFQCDVLNRDSVAQTAQEVVRPPGQAGLPGERRGRQQAAGHDQRRAEVLRSARPTRCAGSSS